jgi:transcriptional regulator with XRE-family HTH domain
VTTKLTKIRPREFLQHYSIGLKLRTLRAAKGLTLTRLAKEVGFSTALLSKLETDHMIPTLPTLARLCRVYGTGLGYFFTEPEQHSLAITRNAHVQAPRARGHESVTSINLHTPSDRGHLLGRIFDLPSGPPVPVGASDGRTELIAYVVQGKVQLSAAGSTELLETDDCLFLDTNQAALWSAVGDAHCRLLMVAARQGQSEQ